MPGLSTNPPPFTIIDSRLPDEAGRFESVIESPIERVVELALAPWHRKLDATRFRVRVRIVDLGWRWSVGPFFLAHVAGVARVVVEIFEGDSSTLRASESVASLKSEDVATGDSLRVATDQMLAALEALATQLDSHPRLAFAKVNAP